MENSYLVMLHYDITIYLGHLLRVNACYVSSDMNRYSLHRLTDDFKTLEEVMNTKYPGYCFDDQYDVAAKPETKTVDFD